MAANLLDQKPIPISREHTEKASTAGYSLSSIVIISLAAVLTDIGKENEMASSCLQFMNHIIGVCISTGSTQVD